MPNPLKINKLTLEEVIATKTPDVNIAIDGNNETHKELLELYNVHTEDAKSILIEKLKNQQQILFRKLNLIRAMRFQSAEIPDTVPGNVNDLEALIDSLEYQINTLNLL